jgi:glutamate 5-kinase
MTRVVVKVGTSSLVDEKRDTLKLSSLCKICETLTDLNTDGLQIVLVSSGAVGTGCQRIGIDRKDVTTIAQKQALAAIGQGNLQRQYDDIFSALGQHSAQVLLTLDNIASRSQYRNASATFEELLKMKVIPVVNENDTVATTELRFGDNDTLSAQVAVMIGADWLFLLTDVDALYTANPNSDPNAKAISVVDDLNTLAVTTDGCGSKYGTGGMATKLTAAHLASAAGCKTVICWSNHPENIGKIIKGDRSVGTTINAISERPPKPTKKWILSISPKGSIKVDFGAAKAVLNRKSLFAAGIVSTSGNYRTQDAVKVLDVDDNEIARGLVNYNSSDVEKLIGKVSQEYEGEIGYPGPEEIIYRYNIVRTCQSNGRKMKAALSLNDLTIAGQSGEGSLSDLTIAEHQSEEGSD